MKDSRRRQQPSALETPDTAPYRTSVAPRLDAEPGGLPIRGASRHPRSPRRRARPRSCRPLAEQQEDQRRIPCAVARDPTNLGAVGTPVFARALRGREHRGIATFGPSSDATR